MKRGPIEIPYEAVDRTIEWMEGADQYPRVKRYGHLMVFLSNALSALSSAYHFRSIGDFTYHEHALQPHLSKVILHDITIMEKQQGISSQHQQPYYSLDFLLSDMTGGLKLHYVQPIEIVEGEKMPPDWANDPLMGAQEGDVLSLYCARYSGLGSLHVERPWHVMNDQHYARVRASRGQPPRPWRRAG